MFSDTVSIRQNRTSDVRQIRLPFSKSISNRLLMLQLTTNPRLVINNLSQAEDTLLLRRLIEQIGNASPSSVPVRLFAGDCASAYRFLCAYLAGKEGRWILEASAQMCRRPVGGLVDSLRAAGAEIDYLGRSGFPPLAIRGRRLEGKEYFIRSTESSQYVSAILLSLAQNGQNATVYFDPLAPSLPYVDMTIRLIQQAGVNIRRENGRIDYIHRENLPVATFLVEPDWSSAAVWFVSTALSENGRMMLKHLRPSFLQNDSVIAEMVQPFGVRTTFDEDGAGICKIAVARPEKMTVDCGNCLDLVPYLVVLSVGSGTEAVFKQVDNLTIKESHRILALQRNLSPYADITYAEGNLRIGAKKKPFGKRVVFHSFNDHRIAMALSALCGKIEQIRILSARCTDKSYPDFWREVVL